MYVYVYMKNKIEEKQYCSLADCGLDGVCISSNHTMFDPPGDSRLINVEIVAIFLPLTNCFSLFLLVWD